MEEIEKLYNVLSRDGYYTKTFEEFQAQWEDPNYREKVFGVVSRDGLFTKSKDEFLQKYSASGTVKKNESGTDSGSTSGLSGGGGSKSQSQKLLDEYLKRMGADTKSTDEILTPEQKAATGLESEGEKQARELLEQKKSEKVTDAQKEGIQKAIDPDYETKKREREIAEMINDSRAFYMTEAEELGVSIDDVKEMTEYREIAPQFLSESSVPEYEAYRTMKTWERMYNENKGNPSEAQIFENYSKAQEDYQKLREEQITASNNRIFELEREKLSTDNKTRLSELNEAIIKEKASQEAYFNPTKVATDFVKNNPDAMSQEGDDPIEKLSNYYHGLYGKWKKLNAQIGMGETVASRIPIVGGAFQENVNELFRIQSELETLAPIVLMNRKKLREDNFGSQFAKNLGKGLIDESAFQTEQDEAAVIGNALQDAMIESGVSDINAQALEESERMTLMEEIGAMGGSTTAMVPSFIGGGALVKGLSNVGKLATISKAANNSNKFIKGLYGATETGLAYEASSLFSGSDVVDDEASFLAGFLGGAFTSALGGAANKIYQSGMNQLFGKSTPMAHKIIDKAITSVGTGLGETVEEYGNTIGQLIEQADGDFMELLKEEFGTLDKNLKFGLMTFGMGMVFGHSTQVGRTSMKKFMEWRQNQPAEVVAKFDKVASQINDGQKEIAAELQAPVSEGGVSEVQTDITNDTKSTEQQGGEQDTTIEQEGVPARESGQREQGVEKSVPKITVYEEITVYKGKDGKKNIDGSMRSAHPNVKGSFASESRAEAERYGEVEEIKIPKGATIETVEITDTNQPMSEVRAQEEKAINNSNAQVVKLVTYDATGGKQEQYIIKDESIYSKTERESGQREQGVEKSVPKITVYEGENGTPSIKLSEEQQAAYDSLDAEKKAEVDQAIEDGATTLGLKLKNEEDVNLDINVALGIETAPVKQESVDTSYEAEVDRESRELLKDASDEQIEGIVSEMESDAQTKTDNFVSSVIDEYGEGSIQGRMATYIAEKTREYIEEGQEPIEAFGQALQESTDQIQGEFESQEAFKFVEQADMQELRSMAEAMSMETRIKQQVQLMKAEKELESAQVAEESESAVDEANQILGEAAQKDTEAQQAIDEEIKAMSSNYKSMKVKGIRDLYKVGRNLFGLNRSQALAQAILSDKMIANMAKRDGISKSDMYKKIEYRKAEKAPDGSLKQAAPSPFRSNVQTGLAQLSDNPRKPAQWIKEIIKAGGKGTAKEISVIGLDAMLKSANKNKKGAISKSDVEEIVNLNTSSVYEVVREGYGAVLPSDVIIDDNFSKDNKLKITLLDNHGEVYDFFDGMFEIEKLEMEDGRTRYHFLEEGIVSGFGEDLDVVKKEAIEEIVDTINNDALGVTSLVELAGERDTGAYEQFILGGNRSNYREILLTLNGKSLFESKHFPQENVIVHSRVSDRHLPNGEKVLFIEEVQSDWSQARRKYEKFRDAKDEDMVFDKDVKTLHEEAINLAESWKGSDNEKIPFFIVPVSFNGTEFRTHYRIKYYDGVPVITGSYYKNGFINNDRAVLTDIKEFERLITSNIKEKIHTHSIDPMAEINSPTHKSTDDWSGLAIRKLFQLAVDGGYDRVSWATGEQVTSTVGGNKEGQTYFYNKIIPRNVSEEAKRFGNKNKLDIIQFNENRSGVGVVGKQLSLKITPEMRMNLNGNLPLFQDNMGAMMESDGRYIIYALTNPNVSTPLHELAHVFEKYLTDEERADVLKWAGTKEWTVETSEKFARGFERWLSDGKSPLKSLEAIFRRMSDWLIDIYKGVKNSEIDIVLNEKMQNIYSSMLDKPRTPAEREWASERKKQLEKDIDKLWDDIFKGGINFNSGLNPQELIENARRAFELVHKYAQLGITKLPDVLSEAKSKLGNQYNNLESSIIEAYNGYYKKENLLTNAWDAIVRNKKKYLNASRLLPKQLFQLKEAMEGKISKMAVQTERILKQVNKDLKKYQKEGTRDRYEFLMNEYMTSKDPARVKRIAKLLPRELVIDANLMRTNMDVLSYAMLQEGLVSGATYDAVEYNLGHYMNRSYRLYDDKNWKKNVSENIKAKARAYLVKAYLPVAETEIRKKNPQATNQAVIEAAENYADSVIYDILNKGKNPYLQSRETGIEESSILKKRKDIPIEIRMLMGEYSNPLYNYAQTIMKQVSFVESARMINEMNRVGDGHLFFDQFNAPKGYVKIKDSDKLGALAGRYTTKEIRSELENFLPKLGESTDELNKMLQYWMRVVSFTKSAKTIYSYVTHLKNVLGNIGFMAANGHWSVSKFDSSIRDVIQDVRGTGGSKLDAEIDRLVELQVIRQSASIGELKDMFKDANMSDESIGKIFKKSFDKRSKIGKALFKVRNFSETAYQAEDDFFKIYAFKNEVARYSEAFYNKKPSNLTDEELSIVEEHAAEIVKNTYPTYSRVPEIVKKVRRFPFFGNFVSFQAESIRTSFNTLEIAVKDLNSGDAGRMKAGAKRLAGIMTYLSAKTTIFGYTSSALGLGMTSLVGRLGLPWAEEDEESEKGMNYLFRLFVYPWSKSSDLIPTQMSDGHIKYYDMSASDPHGGLRKAFNAWLEGDGFFEGARDALLELFDPFLQPEIAARAIAEVLSNETPIGRVYEPTDNLNDKILDITFHLWKGVEFGSVKSVRDLVKAEDKSTVLWGQLFGMREYDIDVSKAFYFKAADIVKSDEHTINKQDIIKNYNRSVYSEDSSPENEEREYVRLNAMLRDKYMELTEYYYAAVASGVDSRSLDETLKMLRLSKEDIKEIKTGVYKPFKRKGYIGKNR